MSKNIEKVLPGIKKSVSLKNHSTFGIGGKAKYFFLAKTKKDFIDSIEAAKKTSTPFFILGSGSNILISDKGYCGLIIKFQGSNVDIKRSVISAEAGVLLSSLAAKALRGGLSGLEWAVGIPGTLGGSVFGNAGAFSQSM